MHTCMILAVKICERFDLSILSDILTMNMHAVMLYHYSVYFCRCHGKTIEISVFFYRHS